MMDEGYHVHCHAVIFLDDCQEVVAEIQIEWCDLTHPNALYLVRMHALKTKDPMCSLYVLGPSSSPATEGAAF